MKTILSVIAAFGVAILLLLAAVAQEAPAGAEQAAATPSPAGHGEAVEFLSVPRVDGPVVGGPQAY
jgi:hypothetical protein